MTFSSVNKLLFILFWRRSEATTIAKDTGLWVNTDRFCCWRKKISEKLIVVLFLEKKEVDGVSQLLVSIKCFQIRKERKQTGLNNRGRIGLSPESLRRRVGHLWELLSWPTVSHRLHRYVFSDGHLRRCLKLLRNLSNATSTSAPKSHPHHPSIFILLLPRRIDFPFSLFSPSSPLSSSSLHLLKHTSNSSACLS